MSAPTLHLVPAADAAPACPFPPQLVNRDQWGAAKVEPNPDPTKKPRKILCNADGNIHGSGDADLLPRLMSYADARALAATDGFAGVGFRLMAGDPFCIIDLDWKDRPGATEAIPDDLQAVVDRFPGCWTERSISRKGLHILVLGKPDARGKGKDAAGSLTGVELYDRGQFILLTGDVLPGRTALTDMGAEVRALKAEQRIGDALTAAGSARVTERWNVDLDDDAVLALCSQRFRDFDVLYHTNEVRPGKSQSEPAFALLLRLAAAVGNDPDRIKALVSRRDCLREHPRWPEQRGKSGTLLDGDVRRAIAKLTHADRLAPKPTDAEPASRWPLYTDRELLAQPEPAWLLQDVLFAGGLTVLYGMKGTYKSFVALSWALAVGTGQPWLGGRAARRGTVVYIVAEGKGFFKRRVAAARDALGLRPDAESGVRWVTVPVNLFNGDADAFAAHVRERIGDAPVALYVFDTLARSMVGAEENSNSDFAVVIEAAQRLQQADGAAVLLVHHTGKDGLTARGGYALVAAADGVLKLELRDRGQRTTVLTFENTKDLAEPAPLGLRLVPREESLVVTQDDTAVTAPVDNAGNAKIKARRQALLAAMGTVETWTVDALAGKVNRDRRVVGDDLRVLFLSHPPEVGRSGTGSKGDPHVYRAAF